MRDNSIFEWLLLTIKKLRLKLNYRRMIKMPLLLFVVSFILFLLILLPNSFHRCPILGSDWPRELEIDGYLYMSNPNDRDMVAISGAKIEIGGYRAITNSKGEFHISFVSKSYTDIPLVIQWSEQTWIKRVSFKSGELYINEVIIINEK